MALTVAQPQIERDPHLVSRISLVGLPGSGKSTVGRQLARRLSLPFVDSDPVIEQRIGCSIREYFEREGEERFRDIEEAVLDHLTQSHRGVLSTGGGSALRAVNRQRLRARSHVIYLRSSPEELFRRLRRDVNRPLLQVSDPFGRLRDLYTARDPLYREVAHFVVETGRPSVAALVGSLLAHLEQAGVLPNSTGPSGLPDSG
ncbi:MAG: shikimate kinase [Polaromonas sp.]|nr:shikimate kinase [Polaromonas sp.]